MSISVNAFFPADKEHHHVYYEPVSTCPCCKASIEPIFRSATISKSNIGFVFFVSEFCNSCKEVFISKYRLTGYSLTTTASSKLNPSNGSFLSADELLSCEPNRFCKQNFDCKIETLSPQFIKIYNQALAAESAQLDEIAGLGYRKSLEFLIKDFAISENPDDAEDIKAKPLGQCIQTYIDNSHIKTLAERSAWIGNDEAHYIRKQEDRDVSDMKDFIQAIVYFIGMILITKDAASMTPKR